MKNIKKYWKIVIKNKFLISIFIIFLFELFTRFYKMDVQNPFGYDQVDNAWAAKNLIVNHQFPLVGMVAKADSGIYIGPAYYYIVALFYWLFNLNIIASPVLAGITSIFTFWTIYYCVKKLLNDKVALIAVLINTFNINAIIYFDKIQWPVAPLPAISLIIFYLLFRVISGEVKKILLLAIFVGIAFNLHFTAIFFPIIIILSLPFFPRTKEMLKYIILGIPLFLIWIVPNLIGLIINKYAVATGSGYISTYYHGFHLKRMIQLAGDAIIQFDPYLFFQNIKIFKFILLPLFFILYFKNNLSSGKIKFLYLVALWYLIPWLVFTTYSGEISDYYFIISRYITLMVISYMLFLIWNLRFVVTKLIIAAVLILYCSYNFINFLPYNDQNLKKNISFVQQVVAANQRVEFQVGVPQSYLYYYYMRQKGIEVYVSKSR